MNSDRGDKGSGGLWRGWLGTMEWGPGVPPAPSFSPLLLDRWALGRLRVGRRGPRGIRCLWGLACPDPVLPFPGPPVDEAVVQAWDYHRPKSEGSRDTHCAFLKVRIHPQK